MLGNAAAGVTWGTRVHSWDWAKAGEGGVCVALLRSNSEMKIGSREPSDHSCSPSSHAPCE